MVSAGVKPTGMAAIDTYYDELEKLNSKIMI